ncbi:hypothetical protein TeGR_g2273, partial [Tetraparma gracilis]
MIVHRPIHQIIDLCDRLGRTRYLIASGNDVGDHLRLFAQDFKNDPWVQYTVGDLQAIADRDAMVAMVGAAFGGPMRANSRVVEACNRLGWSR